MAKAREGSKYNKMVDVKESGEDKNAQMQVTDEANLGKLRSIRIEPAANGLTVTSDHAPKEKNVTKGGPKTASPMEYGVSSSAPPAAHVFTDHESALAHIKGKLERHAKMSA